mmetsp:Transcript_4279/g.11678  ORF Transcript_4279/g.11678 Transcript_4279/m.11678 type:complete len:297 (+) Transcript_4279:142-1032(+)
MALGSKNNNDDNLRTLLSDVPRRLLTICVGVPILWCLWSISSTRQLFFQGTNVAICWEWGVLTKMKSSSRILFLLLSVALTNIQDSGPFTIALLFCTALFPMINSSDRISPTAILSWTAGFLLIPTPFRAWLDVSQDFHATVSLLLTVWNADTGALFFGRLGSLAQTNLPRPHWLRAVSPSKSVEGLIGGLVGGTLTYWALPWFWAFIFGCGLSPVSAMGGRATMLEATTPGRRLALGFVLSLAAIVGDLWESSLKRAFQVKDSGKLLPGHGGVLDRFDSSLLAVVVYQQVLLSKL